MSSLICCLKNILYNDSYKRRHPPVAYRRVSPFCFYLRLRHLFSRSVISTFNSKGWNYKNLSEYFDSVQIPYVSYYSYGEHIAVLKERSESLSLRRAYENFSNILFYSDAPWETKKIEPIESNKKWEIEPANRKKVDLYNVNKPVIDYSEFIFV